MNVTNKKFRASSPALVMSVYALVIFAPAFLSILNHNWMFINFYQPPWFDSYVYLSLFQHPIRYMSAHHEYYPTSRVSFILIGAPFYQIFEPLLANLIFKLSLFAATIALFLASVKQLAGAKSAFISAVLLATYPFFVSTMGWDYVDMGAILFFSALYLLTFRTYQRGDNFIGEVVWGIVAVFLLNCHFYTIVLFPWIGLLYLGLRLTRGDQNLSSLARSVATIGAGALIGSVILSVASGLMGGSYLFLLSQFTEAFKLRDNPAWGLAVWGDNLKVATWLALPICTTLLALRSVLITIVERWRHGKGVRDFRSTLILAHYIAMATVFTATTFTSVAVGAFWFYASFLVIPSFVVLATLISMTNVQAMDHRSVFGIGFVGFVVLLLLFNHSIGGALQSMLNMSAGTISTLDALMAVALAFATGAVALLLRSFSVSLLAIIALGYANLLMMSHPQFNHRITRDRQAAFSAVVQSAEEIAEGNKHGRQLRVWIDRTERNGGLFHGAYIASLLSGKKLDFEQVTQFPSLPSRRFRPGQRVAIMSSLNDWLEQASAALQKQSLRLEVEKVLPIEQGAIKFVLAQGVIREASN